MENRHDKFKRIAENRTNKILHYIDLLGNCSNRRSYDYTDEEIKKIFTAIEKELQKTKHKFQNSKSKSKQFTLD